MTAARVMLDRLLEGSWRAASVRGLRRVAATLGVSVDELSPLDDT